MLVIKVSCPSLCPLAVLKITAFSHLHQIDYSNQSVSRILVKDDTVCYNLPRLTKFIFRRRSPTENYSIEYKYDPSPDAEERLAQAWEVVLFLILEDVKNEQQETHEPGGETC